MPYESAAKAPGIFHPKVTFVVTVPLSARFFQGQVAYFARNGFRVEFVCSPGTPLNDLCLEGAIPRPIPIQREIALLDDLISLLRLWLLFRRTKPDLAVSGTPKAGLLGTVAARLAGVECVVYTMHGLRLETASGGKRRLLWLTEWLACSIADHVRMVSPSLMRRVIGLGLVSASRCSVCGAGTSNGIETSAWKRTPQAELVGRQTREQLGIPLRTLVIGFVGRLTRDKGVTELYQAFKHLQGTHPDCRLLLVGNFEEGDPIPAAWRDRICADPSVFRTGFVTDIQQYYWAMDVFALPSHREGFPGAPLEAQAASVPVVCTDATGAADSVVDGVTGFRVQVGNVAALTAALSRLLGDAELRTRMGEAGRIWVEENFARQIVWKSILEDYRAILNAAPRRRRAPLRRAAKVAFDRSAAAFLLLLSAPLCLVAALAVRLFLGVPVLFRQVRPGRHGHPFTLLKFRTMRDTRDTSGALLPDETRMTGLGRLLRASSIDELPQLWNVLRGEMSLVGPRPLLMKYLPLYTPEQWRRHAMKPGITGWAQVNGRNALSWERRFALDTWYIDHWSLALDLRILGLTIARMRRREGICQEGHATMSEFCGSVQAGEAHE